MKRKFLYIIYIIIYIIYRVYNIEISSLYAAAPKIHPKYTFMKL